MILTGHSSVVCVARKRLATPDCFSLYLVNEPPHDQTNKMACAPSEHSDQPGRPPSRIRVFAEPSFW